MLTKELLRFRNLSGYVKPMFVDPADPRLNALAGDIIGTYRAMIGAPRNELDDALMPIVNAQHDIKLARGLVKTFDDAVTTTANDSESFPELRRTLFLKASQMLSGPEAGDDPAIFRDRVFDSLEKDSVHPLREDIYADLPDYEKLAEIPEWSTEELLGRYNCSLAQSLVIYAKTIELAISEPNAGKMRRFFKYMKFFRLLAAVRQANNWENGAPATMKLQIDGPAAILENGMAYGLRMASFLPALFQLPKWKMSCQLLIRGKLLKFNLDDTAGLNRRFGTFSCYIPEEYTMFEKLFAEKSEHWKLSDEIPFLRKKNSQEFIFPDMSFTDGTQLISLELFHKWHAHQLEERIKLLEEEPELPLIIGADRSIFPHRSGETPQITEHPLFGKKIFLFRDFPGVANVLKLLDKTDLL